MDLILWRHAEAREIGDRETDADRPLTDKGRRQAKRMAEWLSRHLPESTRVLVSPTARTRQTAEALVSKFRTAEELGPERSVTELLHAARWPDARGAVLVVGHQATLGMTAAYLMSGDAQPWSIRKGAVWWLRQRERESGTTVVLHAAAAPDLL